MCGISVLLEPNAPVWLAETARRMTRLISHRGPDDEGLIFMHPRGGIEVTATDQTAAATLAQELPYCPRQIDASLGAQAFLALGHRRLSIIDCSPAGHQPMCDSHGSAWITFNGEIFNYSTLRAELERLGHRFNSHTDTEVIIAAYLQWGRQCLDRLNGMFAFAILDLRDQSLFIARDRFGVKPLYIWTSPSGGLVVASEIKQFTVHPAWKPRINGQRVYDFLQWGVTDHTNETLFSGVSQLRGGQYINLRLPAVRERVTPAALAAATVQWYSPKAAPFTGTMDQAAVRFIELLSDSVNLRLRADVPVGSCLSGGLDSSSIVCLMSRLLRQQSGGNLRTFSAYSDTPRFDERRYVRDVVAATSADAHATIPVPETLVGTLPRITWHQDEPFGSTSILAQWAVFALARDKGVQVVLDGQGADEILAGYPPYFHRRLVGLLVHGEVVELLRECTELNRVAQYTWPRHLKALATLLLPRGLCDTVRRARGKHPLALPYLNLAQMGAVPRHPFSPLPLHDSVGALSHSQLTTSNLPMLLHWEDRNSMAHGVESRVPFLDYRLVEFCLGLPEEYKIAGGRTKLVLREAMCGVLPESVRRRTDKIGFATAEEVWVKESHRSLFLEALRRAVDQSRGLLSPTLLDYGEHMQTGRIPFSTSLWRSISLGAWMGAYDVASA